MNDTKKETRIDPEPVKETGPVIDTELVCPDGYPADEWEKLNEGNKRLYYFAMRETAKRTRGEI
jgi:hypothetical protein